MSLDLNWRLVKDQEFTDGEVFDAGCVLMLIGVPAVKTEDDVRDAAMRVYMLDRVAQVFDGKMTSDKALQWARRWRGLQSNASGKTFARFKKEMTERLDTDARLNVGHAVRREQTHGKL